MKDWSGHWSVNAGKLAKRAFEESVNSRLETQASETGPLSLEIGHLYEEIGNEAFGLGFAAEAAKAHSAALEILMLFLPQHSETLGDCYLNIGNDFCTLGRFTEALQSYQRAWDIYSKTVHSDHSALANVFNSVGAVYTQLQDWGKAATMLTKAAKSFEKHGDERQAEAYNNLGIAHQQMGHHRRALRCLLKAKSAYRRLRPRDKVGLGNVANNLGSVYYSLHQADRALALHLAGWRIRKKALAPTHPDLALSYNNVGNDYLILGNADKAATFLEAAVCICSAQLPNSSDTLRLIYDNLRAARSAAASCP